MLTIWSSNCAPWYLPKKVENLHTHTNLHLNIYCSFTHNCQNLEAIEIFFICNSYKVGEKERKLSLSVVGNLFKLSQEVTEAKFGTYIWLHIPLLFLCYMWPVVGSYSRIQKRDIYTNNIMRYELKQTRREEALSMDGPADQRTTQF